MIFTIFIISWVLVGVATASLLTYLDYRTGANVTIADIVIGTVVGIIFGYGLIFFLIKGMLYDYDPPEFWNKIVWKSKEDSK